jgi:hypothetical protein
MPQNPIKATIVTRVFRAVAAAANLLTGSGTLVSIIVVAPGSAGNLTLNDCTTTGAAAAGNQILSVAFGALTAGQVITVLYPYKLGVTVSAITTGGSFHVSIGH